MARKPKEPQAEATDTQPSESAEDLIEAVILTDEPAEADELAANSEPVEQLEERDDVEAPEASDHDVIPVEDSAPHPAEPVRRAGSNPVVWAIGGGILALVLSAGFVTYQLRPGGLFNANADAIAALEDRLAQAERAAGQLTGLLDEQTARTQALADQVAGLTSAQETMSDDVAGFGDVAAAVGQFEQRLADLENRPIPDIGATQEAVDAYERELTAMRDMLAEELAHIRAQSEQTASLAQEAVAADKSGAAREISAGLREAIIGGLPRESYLDMAAREGVEVPSLLADPAQTYVSLAQLQSDLAGAAREAVAIEVRQKAQDGEIGRVEAFLRLQLGARSLAPAEGGGAEPTLARAENALAKGDVDGALSEVTSLAVPGATGLEGWITDATRHRDAVEAANSIANSSEKE